jgi:hypothetical protein
LSERRSAFAKARSIADTYWASFAKAAAAFEREAAAIQAVVPTAASTNRKGNYPRSLPVSDQRV